MDACQHIWKSLAGAALAFLVLAGAPLRAGAGDQPPLEGSAAVQFVQRTRDYVSLRSAAIESLPELAVTSSPVEISGRERALGVAIGAQRAGAKRGDVFDGASAPIVALVREDWQARPLAERVALWREIPRADPPRLNAPYPRDLPLATFPPTLLTRLPELPDVLEYRFAGPHLILLDVEANLIVDVLPDVLVKPDATSSRAALGADSGQ